MKKEEEEEMNMEKVKMEVYKKKYLYNYDVKWARLGRVKRRKVDVCKGGRGGLRGSDDGTEGAAGLRTIMKSGSVTDRCNGNSSRIFTS